MPYFEMDISPWVDDTRRLVGGKRYADTSMGELSGLKTVRGFVQVSGIPAVLQNWKEVDRYVRGWATRRARMAAAEIAAQSQIEVPKDSGDLAGSMFVVESNADYGDGAIRVDVGYNTDEIDYAWIQHENPEYNHPTPGTKMHYLKDPFDDVSARYPQEVQYDVKAAVERVNFRTSATGGIADSDYEDDEGMGIDDFWAKKRGR